MNTTSFKKLEVWFLTGTQHLYGEATLIEVAEHAKTITAALTSSSRIPVSVVYKPILKTAEEIYSICQLSNDDKNCIGLITWMHTFSPAKMWIRGLQIVQKPILHLHTQFNRDIPWATIDMDFMNLNQSAHGDREFGFIMSRMRMERKVVAGHWQDQELHRQISDWSRSCAGKHDWQGAKFVRFGDNMRNVAVTEGDKVEAEIKFGYSVNTYGVGDLVGSIHTIPDKDIDHLCQEYEDLYQVANPLRKGKEKHDALRESARIELGLESILMAGNYKGFTDTFEDLHGMKQLPGLAVQRLMAKGYGFAGEGDWKTAALVRAMKVMGTGLSGGNSFMEDYTYHLEPGNEMVLGSHMLEICPSIASGKPSCEIHPLGIGGKDDPVRLVFSSAPGPALNASIIDMGNRFRLLVQNVEAVKPPEDLPKLPVARVLWKPSPDLKTGCVAWILAGGAHHTCYSQSLSSEIMQDFAGMMGIECLVINDQTTVAGFRNEIRWNETAYKNG
jgi:L-arabinose isomerase